jgi:hypothetical protein
MNGAARLRAIKLAHTLIWAFFAGCILAIPVAAVAGQFTLAFILCGVVLVEVVILALNRMRCPLTDVAARYTPEREANFDIYLPRWLAAHNKMIFGTLYAAGIALTVVLWLFNRDA